MGRSNQPREIRLLSEFLEERFPKREIWFNVRLGDLTDEEKKRFEGDDFILTQRRARLPRADAIVFDGPLVWIVEAKMEQEHHGAAQLSLYRIEAPNTPRLKELLEGKKVVTLLVIARDTIHATKLCHELGHEVEVFRRPWADAYMASRGELRGGWHN